MTTRISSALRLHPVWLVAHAAIILIGLGALVSAPIQTRSLPLPGQPAPFTIAAHSRTTFVDTHATNREKQRVEAAVPTVYDNNNVAADQSRQQAVLLFQNIMRILSNPSAAQPQHAISQLLRASSVNTSGLPALTRPQWTAARYWSLQLLADSLDIGGFASTRDVWIPLALKLPHSIQMHTHEVVHAIVSAFLRPTLVPDLAATNRKRQEAAAAVKPVTITVSPGTVVVRRGEIVTPGILEELHAVGLPTAPTDWRQRAGSILFAAIVIALFMWYLRAFSQALTGNHRLMFLLDFVILVTAVSASVIVPGHVLLPYFFPAAAATALIGLLASSEVGVSLAVVLALIVGWVVGGSFELTAFYLLTGVTGALAVRKIHRLNDFILSGATVAASAAAVIAAFQLFGGGYDLVAIRNYALAAAFNGLISGALAFGGFVLLGRAFGVTTTFHLLELGHPDHKLLRRLMAEAPGTYNHSLVVASMVERAAGDVGGDVLLARVMALYHDIGKVANPLCFIENQMGTANIHDDLRPRESAEIIRAHVTHGVNLVRQHRLPQPIADAILQHHGTMTMPYFFHRALQEDPDVDAAIYSYPGPRPQSKECGLLMLADGCESAVRASTVKSPEIIRDVVNRIIDERVAGDQLSSCQLTLQDLQSVRTDFVEVLNGIYHPRIEYPAPVAAASQDELSPEAR